MGVKVRQRLRKQTDFLRVRGEGVRVHCGPFIFQCRVSGAGGRRLGVIASRRVGSAVRRNYGKRVFRALFRRHQDRLPRHCDLVVVLRSGFETYPYAELERRFEKACARVRPDAEGGA